MKLNDLKKLKEKTQDPIAQSLINELAREKGYVEINPELTLKAIDDILHKKHPLFRLVDCKLVNVDEGSMAMEYDYDIVFQDENFNFYGVKLKRTALIDGEIWDDYVANEEDEIFEVYKVTAKTISITEYQFENIKKKK